MPGWVKAVLIVVLVVVVLVVGAVVAGVSTYHATKMPGLPEPRLSPRKAAILAAALTIKVAWTKEFPAIRKIPASAA